VSGLDLKHGSSLILSLCRHMSLIIKADHETEKFSLPMLNQSKTRDPGDSYPRNWLEFWSAQHLL